MQLWRRYEKDNRSRQARSVRSIKDRSPGRDPGLVAKEYDFDVDDGAQSFKKASSSIKTVAASISMILY